jgi:hypothetical protein
MYLGRGHGLPNEKRVIETRASRGLDQFFTCIKGETGLAILDLSGLTQSNVDFITNLGHKLYTEDFLRSLYATFPEESDQANQGLIERFLKENLNYEDETFNGVLVWDVLEHMAPPLLAATIERLARIVKPKSYLMALFHAQDRALPVPFYSFCIADAKSMIVNMRGSRTPTQVLNNRTLEKLFHKFESLKFFLTREHLREVIVKR